MNKKEDCKELLDEYTSTQLLNAFIVKEVEFRLKEVHSLSDSQIEKVKDSIICYFQDNSDDMFDYDNIDNIIRKELEI